MFALNDYLAGIALDQLSNQAAVGGISFSTGAKPLSAESIIWAYQDFACSSCSSVGV
jgi:secreted Zn-dependent insulinase-like peptidase